MSDNDITLKTPSQINKIKDAGKIAAEILEIIENGIKPGLTTLHLEILADKHLTSCGAISSFKGYNSFPSSICVSVNDEVVHGMPGLKVLKEGDIVSVDVGVLLNGFHADAARTFAVGCITEEKQRLIDITRQSFYEALKYATQGNYILELSGAIEDFVLSRKHYIVKEYGGHGIGESLHEPPYIPNFREKDVPNVQLEKGMILAIEPIVTMTAATLMTSYNEITVLTTDGSCSSHFENTIAITENEPEILTIY